ncbi:hypothetical protein PHATNISS_83 [Mycobacterium phage Phatniss]|uniref:Uncharacterized protein n=1 Tax=Mycobacterium phage Phatniss TaxID=1698356 RepID=A0A0K1Y7I7_9CAUD|nr:hypothetical protein PHATNISS_83 [Mycobacterium phage Phatniss]AKY02893.1 hypothetical protein PHATNISS_83 [Mycobacterium phage Phatniss]
MSDIVERAKAALEGVAYGPWEFDYSDEGMQAVGGPVIWLGDGDLGFRVEAHYQDDRNAEFIAQARSLVPELIAEVELKSAQLAEWRAQYDAIDAENERLRAQETRIRALAESGGVYEPGPDWISKRAILAALDTEGER